ncbi:hypothetical protein LCI18_004527 [Fusarium solani-melongenae]|uniref:Uncharacterized protein n=1 Tax=Fusarium solani subsp. cucurbitae TaxID=2747967 RepID=A0ACD3YXK0_FUSSC|nr:hypothetical protein LCI18_004527 [Fusarium solani-melongenae]
MAIDLDQQKGSVFKVKEYMDSVSRKLALPGLSNLEAVEQEGSEAHPPLDTDTQDAKTSYSSDLLSILQRCQRRSAKGEPFWPDGLLKRIMTRDRVLESINPHARASIDAIVPPEKMELGLSSRGLVKIYALLSLLGKSEQILAFIEEGLRDEDLPLFYDGADFLVGGQALRCFQGWQCSERSLFDSQQWGFVVPSLRLAPDGSPKRYNLDSRAIMPWAYDSTKPVLEIPGVNGSEASKVHRITIDPDSQELWEPLQKMGLDDTFFALKSLSPKDGDKETFRKELGLRRLSKTRHKHLVTLLASISHNGGYYLLFPYAECDLLQFWKDWHPKPPPQDMEETRWLIRQLSGLVGAMITIHKQAQCHGNICPQNIHCLRSSHDPRGLVVLSSYGIPSLSRAKSNPGSVSPRYWRLRDNVHGDSIPPAYDIWSLGFVFLEFITWFLGGGKLLRQFESRWISQPPGGSTTSSTSEEDITEGHTHSLGIFQLGESAKADERSDSPHVNREAKEWLEELQGHQNCTNFIKDTLFIIEKIMCSNFSRGLRQKAFYSGIQQEFDRLYQQCGGDISAYPSPSGPVSS